MKAYGATMQCSSKTLDYVSSSKCPLSAITHAVRQNHHRSITSSSSSSMNFIAMQVLNKTSVPLCVTYYTTAVMSMLLWPIFAVPYDLWNSSVFSAGALYRWYFSWFSAFDFVKNMKYAFGMRFIKVHVCQKLSKYSLVWQSYCKNKMVQCFYSHDSSFFSVF